VSFLKSGPRTKENALIW